MSTSPRPSRSHPRTLIIDGLFAEPLERALAAAPSGVRVVQLGQSAGAEARLLSAWIRGKRATILGHPLYDVPRDTAETGFRTLCEHVRDGRITVATASYPLAQLADAWSRQASGNPAAKLLVELDAS